MTSELTNIYFIGSLELGAVKIGHSADPYKRFVDIQVGNPYKLTLYGVIEEVPRDHEALIHEKFKDSKLNGEWFKLTDDILQFMVISTTSSEFYKVEEIITRSLLLKRDKLLNVFDLEGFGVNDILEKEVFDLKRRSIQYMLNKMEGLNLVEVMGREGRANTWKVKL